MATITDTQRKVIDLLKHGNYHISYFRGIGTRFTPSAEVIDSEEKRVITVSTATVRALREKGLIAEIKRDFTHTTYSIK